MANAVEIEHVTMRFNMSKDKVDSIKEYMIRLMKRQLFFEEFFALKDVSLNIEKGDVFGIVGLNGSGKKHVVKSDFRYFKAQQRPGEDLWDHFSHD